MGIDCIQNQKAQVTSSPVTQLCYPPSYFSDINLPPALSHEHQEMQHELITCKGVRIQELMR